MAPKLNLNSRTVAAPIAAFTMACLLFVYSRTSIRAAKENAQRHREADGGQISWRNESLRRHGKAERPAEEGPVSLLVGSAGRRTAGKGGGVGERESKQEGEIRKVKEERGRREKGS